MHSRSQKLGPFLLLNISLLATLVPCSRSFGQANKQELANVEVDNRLENYRPAAGLRSQTMKAIGSETMGRMMSHWAEEFQAIYPAVQIEIDAKGSSNAFPALIAGQANLGMMSRAPKKAEIAEFKKRFGYSPTVLPAAIDMVTVWVHKDNPIEGLSLSDLDAIFSNTRKRGSAQRILYWNDFTEDDNFARRPIVCFGRNAASGTYGYFKDLVLSRGDYGPWVNELGGSSLVTQSVGSSPGAIGYSGIGFRNGSTKPLKLSSRQGGKLVSPSPENALDGSYPLSRFLFLVVNSDPRQEIDPAVREFLKFVSSRQGQLQVARDGNVPLDAKRIERGFGRFLKP